MSKIPLIGYSDKLSGRPGDVISFKVSNELEAPYDANLVRVICADPNPDGPGFQLEELDLPLDGDFQSRIQPFYPGSYAIVEVDKLAQNIGELTISANIWPTTPLKATQGIFSCGNNGDEPLISLCLEGGFVTALARSSKQQVTKVTCHEIRLKPRQWYHVWASFDPNLNMITVGCSLLNYPNTKYESSVKTEADFRSDKLDKFIFGAIVGQPIVGHFNGKIESPRFIDLNAKKVYASGFEWKNHHGSWCSWDFGLGINSTRVIDVGPLNLHGLLVNMPSRAMTGSTWTGEEMCWKHSPDQYGAIHFHDDDIYDFGWETDFTFRIPGGLKSGLYAARIRCGEHEDMMPFYVCPPRGRPTAELCVLASTFTYTVYGNHARPNYHPSWLKRIDDWNAYPWNPAVHQEYGLSTYNFHSDGSGICHASHRRPLLSLRPGYITFGSTEGKCSGLRHLQADTHLYAWLEKMGISYDIITDQELHDEGVAALAGYQVVSTGSHPEYHTLKTLEALQKFRQNGGNFMYLGGNGFYWRIAVHEQENGTLEIRRNEGGIRAWAADPGEYYHAFDGAYGGLWRRNNRPPQQLAGVGFSAQGNFHGSYYRVLPQARTAPETAWIFDGVTNDIVGDFGFSGNGAAGFELDRADNRLGTPDNTHVIASSENHHESFIPVPEELLTHITTWSGESLAELIRADMIYQVSETGSQLFSTGSITFCGSLLYNEGENDISKILKNVLGRFLE